MTTKLRALICLCGIAPPLALASWGQQTGPKVATAPKTATPATTETGKEASDSLPHNRLHTELMKINSEFAEVFLEPLRCDADGNLYLRTDPSGVGAIHKLNGKGEQVALFEPTSTDIKIDFPASFAIAPDGIVYQLIIAHEITRYVFAYNRDGSVKSQIKLQKPGLAFFPSTIAVFTNGDLLLSGLEHDKDRNNQVMWPFTGIFSPDGTLRRELTLKDDLSIHDMAASGDPKVTSPESPSGNRAVSLGAVETGADGNVYLMRRLSPAIFYAISPGGSVRRFEVDPGQQDFLPSAMHVVGNRIAILFWQPQTHEEILKVVDLQGREIATYDEAAEKDGGHALGLAFICYTTTPERFTFLETMDDNKLGLITATPE